MRGKARFPSGKYPVEEVVLMDIAQTLNLMIAFGTLIVLIKNK